jgi:hypothetical protein
MAKKKSKDVEQTPREPLSTTVSLRVNNEMLTVLDTLCQENRHTRSVTLLILVEESLRERGLWPPK